jgi:glycosyltransferase involved in cell wall biosynthesis
MKDKYIVAFNRDRDFYQVPIALQKAAKLETLITDFYTPSFLSKRKYLSNAFFRKRSTPEIPSSKTSSTWRALFLQLIIRLPVVSEGNRYRLFRVLDRILSNKAGRIAKKSNAQLFLYSGYAKEAFLEAKKRGARCILFVFHPHAKLPEEILEEDFKTSPEISWSRNLHHLESKLSDNERLTEEMSMADLVITASSFTRKSVEHALPNYKNIKVVPYGTREDYLEIPIQESDRKCCKFLFVGQGVQRKGIHHLVKAWEKSKSLNAQMTFVCSVLDPGIIDHVKRLGIVVKQNVSSKDLKSEFASSDVFIMPSLIEGFGLVYLEALAVGCFTIGSRNTGLPDLDLPNSAGEVIQSIDPDSIAQSIRSAYNRWEHGQLNKEDIRAVAAKYSWRRFQESVIEAIETIPEAPEK